MSIFTAIDPATWVAHNALAFAIRDGFPVAPGHTLIIPKREIPDWFAATDEERAAIFGLVDKIKALLDSEFSPDGFNIGMNCGESAGQTVMHLHVHVIPRYTGDMPDPRGGVRHVIPWMGNYKLNRAAPLATGGDDPFMRHLNPLFARASRIDILAAFVQDSGIALIESQLVSAVERGAQVRILCSDYLHITQEAAVRRLHDLQSAYEGRIKTRIARSWKTSFHPKSWQFITPEGGSVFVGSSNLSHAALNEGIEWNLRLDQHLDPSAFHIAREAFEATWQKADDLDNEFIRTYRQRVLGKLNNPSTLPLGDVEDEVLGPTPTPHSIQLRVLAGLQQAREEGHRRALAVMATGLGKTWLAAFDVQQFSKGNLPRVLYVAHRAEILNQAANTFRALFPTARTSWFVGDQSELGGDFVFASIQKVARPESLILILAQSFDYVIIDEVHHAASDSYQRLLLNLDPKFLLGLTATPDRTDGQDILSLFNDYLVDDVGIIEGIEIGRLVPFKYRGIADTTDFAPIPWRAGKFDASTLAEAVQTQERMAQLWNVISERTTLRTLAFCCTIEHALFVRDWLQGKGLRVAAVVSSSGGDDRAASLQALADGGLDVVCAVDILNEGVDIPAVDRVLFLRPTESKIVFLQQLGRGLRIAPDKTQLEVIDFVGNHNIFAERIRWLLSVGDPPAEFRRLVDDGRMELPAGCSIELSFEAKELLKELVRGREKNPVIAAYRRHKDYKGVRPRASELFQEGHQFTRLRRGGGWMALVHEEGDSQLPQSVFEKVKDWLFELETTSMTKSFKMVSLQAMVEEEALFSGLSFDLLAERSLKIIRRSPELMDDVQGVDILGSAQSIPAQTWLNYWKKNPIAAWSNSAFVKTNDDHFQLQWPANIDLYSTRIQELVREVLDFRLSQYKARRRNLFYGRVTHNDRNPILMIPRTDGAPNGEVIVRLEDGVEWVFRFAKIAVNVAFPVGSTKNRLPDLLYAWFGENAGANNRSQKVRFEMAGDRWFARPVGLIAQLPEVDDELETYLSALEESLSLNRAYDFHRRIIHAMRLFRNANEVEIREYIAHETNPT